METSNAIRLDAPVGNDFREYLERSLRDPFTIDLSGLSLMEVINACVRARSKMHPGYGGQVGCLRYNLGILEDQFRMKLQTVQVTDIFWGYFIDFCTRRGLRKSSIHTMCNQLRSVLNWAVKYNAKVSPTYKDFDAPKCRTVEIALTADEVSRVSYFDVDAFYRGRRADYRETMRRVRDMFVLSCNLYQRHSDMVRIGPDCFERNMFRITQQKTGALAVVDIDRFAIEPKTTYRILDAYGHLAPYTADIGNYNGKLHELMKDVGLNDPVRIEERDASGRLVVESVPKWKLVSSHTARRTAITVNVMRGKNVHDLRKCSGHSDLRIFDDYIRDDFT